MNKTCGNCKSYFGVENSDFDVKLTEPCCCSVFIDSNAEFCKNFAKGKSYFKRLKKEKEGWSGRHE